MHLFLLFENKINDVVVKVKLFQRLQKIKIKTRKIEARTRDEKKKHVINDLQNKVNILNSVRPEFVITA